MMRYVIILKSLLKYTPEDHPDHGVVAKALEAVSVMADHINATKKQTDHARRMQAINTHLVGDRRSLYDSVSSLPGQHRFKPKTFRSPQWCGYCNHLLRGITKQGVRCKKCKFAAHAACAKKVCVM
jgi:Phorbol esters/diacylglycerol binding domain (C1 domain)/RhoGEF domain